MNLEQILPSNMRLELIDDILYRIGLCLTSIRDRPKRHIIDHPIVVLIIIGIFLAERMIIIFIREDNEQALKILGAYGYFIGLRQELAAVFLLMTSLTVGSQLIYYINYRNGIKPTFLRVFQMMSGLVSPKSLGLTDVEEVTKLVKTTKRLYGIIRFNNDVILPVFGPVFSLSIYLFYGKPYDVFIFGIHNAIIFFFYIRFYWNQFLYQFFVFYIMCLYLKIKINALNERLIEMKRRKRFIRIRETLQSFDSLYSEINEYNNIFWSKFLGMFWLIFGSLICTNLYIAVFIPMPLPILFVFTYGLLLVIQQFLFVIFTASSVNYCANESYLIMNSLFTTFAKRNTRLSNVLTKFKVI